MIYIRKLFYYINYGFTIYNFDEFTFILSHYYTRHTNPLGYFWLYRQSVQRRHFEQQSMMGDLKYSQKVFANTFLLFFLKKRQITKHLCEENTQKYRFYWVFQEINSARNTFTSHASRDKNGVLEHYLCGDSLVFENYTPLVYKIIHILRMLFVKRPLGR